VVKFKYWRFLKMEYTKNLSKFAAEIDLKNLPDNVVKKAKDTIMDALGCAMAGYTVAAKEIKPLLELIRENGGQPESTIICGNFKTSCLNSALINGTMVHTIDFDDTHLPSIAHFGACVIPAALAVSEKVGASGADLITAVVAGYEVGGRVSRSVMPTHYERWHSTATNGTVAAAAAAARLLGLKAEEMEVTLGIAADQASGGRYCLDHGDFTKSLHPGMAAMKGVLAALLVQKGASGPKGIFEYSTGYCNVYSSEPDLIKLI
jgi:2-methylcitrate dehydratase PrpD